MKELKDNKEELKEFLINSFEYFNLKYLKGDSSFANWCGKESHKIKKYQLSNNHGSILFLSMGLDSCSEFILNYQSETKPEDNKKMILEYYRNAIVSTENSETVKLIE